jgi:hypothetical protein
LGTVYNRKDYLQTWREFFFFIIYFFFIKTGIRDFLLDIYSAYASFVWTDYINITEECTLMYSQSVRWSSKLPEINKSYFTVFRLLTDFVCLYTYEFWLSLCKIVRSSVILLLPLFTNIKAISKRYYWIQKPSVL